MQVRTPSAPRKLRTEIVTVGPVLAANRPRRPALVPRVVPRRVVVPAQVLSRRGGAAARGPGEFQSIHKVGS